MATERGPIGDPQLPQEDEQAAFRIDNPSTEVLRNVFEFPFPPHEMKVKFKKTGDGAISLPLAVTLHPLHPSVGIGKHHDLGFDHFYDIKADSYDQRMAVLSQLLGVGFKKVSLHVEKYKVKSGQLALADKEETAGKGFEEFKKLLLPVLLESGYELSSIDVDFDEGYTGSSWSRLNPDGDLYSVHPHTLKYDGDKLSIYEERTSFQFSSKGDQLITIAQHEAITKYWDNLKALAGVKEVKHTEEQAPTAPQV